jgi:hypothetical protein
MMSILLRVLFLSWGFALCMPAHAELSCEQLVASAQAGLALRDQGASLGSVLAETENRDMQARFKPDELGLIRRAIRLTFTGEVSIYELASTCEENKSSGSRR